MTEKAASMVTLMAGGDIGPVIKPVDRLAELILPVFEQADIRFAQCERSYSKRGWSPQWALNRGGQHSRLDPEMASIFKTAKLDVVSLASNHTIDWGPEALIDTIQLFHSMGIQTAGAGRDVEEARSPAVVERNGVKIAFLAYCSIIRDGQAAGTGKAGIAPMRAHVYFDPDDSYCQPGTPPKIITVPYEDDLKALQEDIRKAKAGADVVILSLHWGVHHLPKVIASYQLPVAHAAFEAGVDLILGHHAHILKAVEVYKGKVCFYSIGNFLTTGPRGPRIPFEWNLYWHKTEPDSLYQFPVDSKKAMIAKAVISKKGVEKVSFLPTFINKLAQPEAVSQNDSRFQEILNYMEWVSDQYPHRFKVEGNEITVET